jgi:ATP-dependent RNA helicase DeaD
VRLHEGGKKGGKGNQGSRSSGSGKKGPASGSSHGARPGPAPDMARIYIGVGRSQGIRPKDLVGAIANESGLNGRQIGNIEITPNFSLVEVPRASSDEVIRVLRRTTIRGRKTTVRPDRDA